MKKGLLAIIIVLALLLCLLLSVIIMKGTDWGEIGNGIFQTGPSNAGPDAPDGAHQESETEEETAPPAGPIVTDQDNGWDLPEF